MWVLLKKSKKLGDAAKSVLISRLTLFSLATGFARLVAVQGSEARRRIALAEEGVIREAILELMIGGIEVVILSC
jgi:hypothetical protein